MSESKFDENLRKLQDAVRRQDDISPEEAEALHRAREELLAERQEVLQDRRDSDPDADEPKQSPVSSFARRMACRALGTVTPPAILRFLAAWVRHVFALAFG